MRRSGQSEEAHPLGGHRDPTAFLLAQVGAHAASMFGERLKKLRLSRPESGILWNLSFSSSITQRQLAARLRILPSRLVALLDELESKGLIERRRNPDDRRRHSLHLTEQGLATVKLIGEVSDEHQKYLLAALSIEEQSNLGELLQRVAVQQGLTRGVHPGYTALGNPKRHDKGV
jgi:DNA-binding MarR family transcriptional regulator